MRPGKWNDIVLASVTAAGVSLWLFFGYRSGLEVAYITEFGTWGLFTVGQHYIVYVIVSAAAVAGGAAVGAALVPACPTTSAVSAALPLALTWLQVAITGWYPGPFQVDGRELYFEVADGHRNSATVLLMIVPWAAMRVARASARWAALNLLSAPPRARLLGVRWFHWLWLMPMVGHTCAQVGTALPDVARALAYLLFGLFVGVDSGRQVGAFSGVPLVILCGSVAASHYGVWSAYRLLADPATRASRADVALRGIGLPLLAGLPIWLVHSYFQRVS